MAKSRRTAGQPAYFETPEALQQKIDEYFEWIRGEIDESVSISRDGDLEQERSWIREPESPTITGLCYFLGFESRQSFHDYGKRDKFSYTIKRARLRIESEYEKMGQSAKSAAFHIFALKNLGWQDKQIVDQTVSTKDLPAAQWNFIDAKKKGKAK